MTCLHGCVDSNILLASKRCVLWQRICCRDKLGVETNWRYVGKALGLRAKLYSHLDAVYCAARDGFVQTAWNLSWWLTSSCIRSNHTANLYKLTLIYIAYIYIYIYIAYVCRKIIAVYSKHILTYCTQFCASFAFRNKNLLYDSLLTAQHSSQTRSDQYCLTRFILTLQRGVTSPARHAARSHSFVYISTS